MRLALAILVSALLFAATHGTSARPAAAFDYVENGTFESGTTGWTAAGSTTFEVVDGGGMGASGSVAQLTTSSGLISLRQSSFAGTPAGSYQFTARIRMSSSSMLSYAQVASNPSVTTTRFDAPQGAASWFEIGGVVDVTGFTNVTFALGASGSAGDVLYVDDVRFEGAPPATMTPTDTPIPPTSSNTPLPPTGTRTPRPTATPTATRTPAEGEAAIAGEPTVAAGADGPSATLLNADFEIVVDGQPAGWDKYGGTLSSATAPVRSGGRAARLESATDSTKSMFETLVVQGGEPYTFDAWLLHDDPGISSAFLRVSWYASADGSGTALATADSTQRLDDRSAAWRQLTTASIVAPAEAQSAKVRVMLQPASAARAALYIDDASFGSVSMPPAEQDPISTGRVDSAVAADQRQDAPRLDASSSTSRQLSSSTDVQIHINEVLYDAQTSPDAQGEWVELYNAGQRSVSLEGWMLADDKTVDTIDALTIPAGGFALVAAESFFSGYPSTTAPVVIVEGSIGSSLGNDGDVLVLLDPSGRFVDALSWGDNTAALDPAVGDVPEGHSIERRLPGVDTGRATDFVDNERPSPGSAYSMPEVLDAQRERPPRAGTVSIVAGEASSSVAWFPWAVTAGSLALLAGAASWRMLPTLADRLRHQ